MRVSHRQLIIRNTPGLKARGVFLGLEFIVKLNIVKIIF